MPVQSSIHLVDPDLAEGLALFPSLPHARDRLPEFRRLTALADAWIPPPELEVIELKAHGALGAVDLFICKPRNTKLLPAVCAIHGGGFVTGSTKRMA